MRRGVSVREHQQLRITVERDVREDFALKAEQVIGQSFHFDFGERGRPGISFSAGTGTRSAL